MANDPASVKTAATWIYIADWWDGPLDGAVRLDDGRRMWAHMLRENDDRSRVFGLHDLSAEEWAAEDERHALWLECCGNGSYDKPPGWKPTKPIEEFYERYPPGSRHPLMGEPIMDLGDAQIAYPEVADA